MIANLLKNGNKVVAYDINKDAMKAAQDQGATTASSVADLSGKVDAVITMLPTPHIVKDTFLGPKGIIVTVRREPFDG